MNNSARALGKQLKREEHKRSFQVLANSAVCSLRKETGGSATTSLDLVH